MSVSMIYGFDLLQASADGAGEDALEAFDFGGLAIPFESPHPAGSYEDSVARMLDKGPERLARGQSNGDDVFLGTRVQDVQGSPGFSALSALSASPAGQAAKAKFERWWAESDEARDLRAALDIPEDHPLDFHLFDDLD